MNGKVERPQKTDKDEFYSTVDLTKEALRDELAEWQHHYNWQRPHGAHKGKTPMEKYFTLSEESPLSEDVLSSYEVNNKRIQAPNYRLDLKLRKLQRSL